MWIFEYQGRGVDEADSLEAFFQSRAEGMGSDWSVNPKAGYIKTARWESADGACCWVSPEGIKAINDKLDELADNEVAHRYDEGAYRDSMGDWRW